MEDDTKGQDSQAGPSVPVAPEDTLESAFSEVMADMEAADVRQLASSISVPSRLPLQGDACPTPVPTDSAGPAIGLKVTFKIPLLVGV